MVRAHARVCALRNCCPAQGYDDFLLHFLLKVVPASIFRQRARYGKLTREQTQGGEDGGKMQKEKDEKTEDDIELALLVTTPLSGIMKISTF